MNRSDEIAAKKAKLAELKRQREQRQQRQSTQLPARPAEEPPITGSPLIRRSLIDKDEVNHFVDSLIGDNKRKSLTPKDGPSSPSRSNRSSVVDSSQVGHESVDRREFSRNTQYQTVSIATQTSEDLSTSAVLEQHLVPEKKEVITYSVGIQTSDPLPSPPRKRPGQASESDDDLFPLSGSRSPRSPKLYTRRDPWREEELRQQIRKEVEEELKAIKDPTVNAAQATVGTNFPARNLTNEEASAVASSEAFADFVDRAGKVVERALDSEYDLLADYAALDGLEDMDEEDEGYVSSKGKKGRRLKEIAQLYDERWSRKRMISDASFSPKSPELLLASYTKNPSAPQDPSGVVQVWSMHLRSRPEYIFHSTSDILTAQFSPYHPRYILGGTYTGQVLLWDMRDKSPLPRLKTPLAGASAAGGSYGGHTHPIYSISQVGTQNANNIISCSTDGVVCGWTTDMLTQPQESLELTTPPTSSKFEDLAPTCMAFPLADPTSFIVGTEEGTIYPCHRYDRAGAKAGVDGKIRYRGHTAPVTGLDFHSARGPMNLGDLAISSSLDWSIKIWKVKTVSNAVTAAASASSTSSIKPIPSLARDMLPSSSTSGDATTEGVVQPMMDISREDVIYSVRWHPHKPGVFSLVDGSGTLEVWDLTADTEVPVCSATPDINKITASLSQAGGYLAKSLNKVAWEPKEGKKVVVGGASGVVSVFEVPARLAGGEGSFRQEEWVKMKKLIGRMSAGNI